MYIEPGNETGPVLMCLLPYNAHSKVAITHRNFLFVRQQLFLTTKTLIYDTRSRFDGIAWQRDLPPAYSAAQAGDSASS